MSSPSAVFGQSSEDSVSHPFHEQPIVNGCFPQHLDDPLCCCSVTERPAASIDLGAKLRIAQSGLECGGDLVSVVVYMDHILSVLAVDGSAKKPLSVEDRSRTCRDQITERE